MEEFFSSSVHVAMLHADGTSAVTTFYYLQLIITSREVDLVNEAIASENILDCDDGGPCAKKPCQNGGQCREVGTTQYQCQCTSGFTGESWLQCRCFSLYPFPCRTIISVMQGINPQIKSHVKHRKI